MKSVAVAKGIGFGTVVVPIDPNANRAKVNTQLGLVCVKIQSLRHALVPPPCGPFSALSAMSQKTSPATSRRKSVKKRYGDFL